MGRSPALLEAIELARRVARGRTSVLVEGETGVGKELFVRLLHAESGRGPNAPFVPVNCGAVAKELFGSELFGHMPGAFTGASREGRPGKFELADGGVLCLDEIGEMPLDIQPYLLRVLEDRIVYRLGDSKGRPVDVDLVALTNRDLKAEVEAGRFRRDLYYRIGAVTIAVPPLRERGDDVLLLVNHFNHQIAVQSDLEPLRFPDAVMAALLAYAWPGNVRELKNLIVRLHLLAPDRVVGLGHLPAEFSAPTAPVPHGTPPVAHQHRPDDPPSHHPGHRHRGRQHDQGGAGILGISRPTLYRKLKLYAHPALNCPSEDGPGHRSGGDDHLERLVARQHCRTSRRRPGYRRSLKRWVIRRAGSSFFARTVFSSIARGDGVDQPRGDRDVVRPQRLQMEIDLGAVHADVGDGAAGRHDLLAQHEGSRDAHGLDRGVDAAALGQLHHRSGGVAGSSCRPRRSHRTAGPLRAGSASRSTTISWAGE